jgi:transposase-like protein
VHNHPKVHSLSDQKKVTDRNLSDSLAVQALSEFQKHRIILDLAGKTNSPHDIMDFFHNIYEEDITYYGIRQVILQYADKIAEINFRFDQIACNKIRMIEFDEIFKGRKICFLVIVDAETGYILFLHWLTARTKENILALLMPNQELFDKVQVVLTDGALYYPEVIKTLCRNAIHQTCLIHVIRKLFPFIDSSESQYLQALHNTTDERKELTKTLDQHKDRQSNVKCFREKIRYWEKKRAEFLTQNNLNAYEKNILTKYPWLQQIANTLNETRTKFRSMKNTLQKDREKIKKKKMDVKFAKNRQDVFWNQYMDQLHVLYRFYALFQPSKIPFETRASAYQKTLEKWKAESLAKEILRLLRETPNLGSIFSANCPLKLTRQYINTNVIESANSRLRPFLDKLRKWQDTPYSEVILNLIRLRLNASHPYSGLRKNTAPIERYGYFLRSRSWIDLILKGLPPGPQSINILLNENCLFPLSCI